MIISSGLNIAQPDLNSKILFDPFQAVYLTVAGWTLQQVLRFLALTVKTRCAQTVDGLNASFIKSLYCKDP